MSETSTHRLSLQIEGRLVIQSNRLKYEVTLCREGVIVNCKSLRSLVNALWGGRQALETILASARKVFAWDGNLKLCYRSFPLWRLSLSGTESKSVTLSPSGRHAK